MCECLDYEDGDRYQCPVCADMSREADAALAAAREEMERLNAEREEAAGECMVTTPEVGSDAGKLLIANRLMRARIAELEAVVGRLIPYAQREAQMIEPSGDHVCGDPNGGCDGDCAAYAGIIADIAAAQAAQRGEG